jgi:hypothetical protein
MSYAHIKGAEFTHTGKLVMLEDEVPVPSFVGWTGAAQVQTYLGALVENLTFEWQDAEEGYMTISSSTGTGSWPVGVARLLISLTSPAGQKVIAPPTLFAVTPGFV